MLYVRATCFYLVGHPQALQERHIQELFSFSALWDPKCLHVSVTEAKKYISLYKVYTSLYTFFVSVTETCKHLGSHNAEKLNNSWICFSWRA